MSVPTKNELEYQLRKIAQSLILHIQDDDECVLLTKDMFDDVFSRWAVYYSSIYNKKD